MDINDWVIDSWTNHKLERIPEKNNPVHFLYITNVRTKQSHLISVASVILVLFSVFVTKT